MVKEDFIDATLQAYRAMIKIMQEKSIDSIKQERWKHKAQILDAKIKILQEVFPNEMDGYSLL